MKIYKIEQKNGWEKEFESCPIRIAHCFAFSCSKKYSANNDGNNDDDHHHKIHVF